MKIYRVSARRLSDGKTILKEPPQASLNLEEAIMLAKKFALEKQEEEGTGWVFNVFEEESNN